jgi:hypothetical protein
VLRTVVARFERSEIEMCQSGELGDEHNCLSPLAAIRGAYRPRRLQSHPAISRLSHFMACGFAVLRRKPLKISQIPLLHKCSMKRRGDGDVLCSSI